MKKCKLVRLISILIILGFTALNLTAVVSEKTLEIKAYKNNYSSEDVLAVYITDAITSSLKLVTENSGSIAPDTNAPELEITPYVENQLLGNIDDGNPEISEENIVFSYRVVGNQVGIYTLKLTIQPFIQQVTSSPVYISAYYNMLNKNVIFQGSSDTTSTDGWTIKQENLSSVGSTSSSSSAAILEAQWIVTNSMGFSTYRNGMSHSRDLWIARGAIAAVIDKKDYQGAPNGEYKAYCKVEVTYD